MEIYGFYRDQEKKVMSHVLGAQVTEWRVLVRMIGFY
jgi:hypothetical protein